MKLDENLICYSRADRKETRKKRGKKKKKYPARKDAKTVQQSRTNL